MDTPLTYREAAELLGITTADLEQLIGRNVLPAIRTADGARIPRRAVLLLVERRAVARPTDPVALV